MPPARTYINDVNSKEARPLDDAFDKEMTARQREYERAWKYYFGNHDKHLKDDASNTRDNVTVNLYGLGIDKGVSSLMGTTDQGTIKGPDFDVVEPEPTPANVMQQMVQGVKRVITPRQMDKESPAETWLDKAWEANMKPVLLHDMALSGGVCGHVFLKIIPNGARDPDTYELTLPGLISLNPAHVAVFWHAPDMRRVLWYRIQFKINEAETFRQDIIRLRDDDGNDLPKWEIRDYSKGGPNAQGGRNEWQLDNTQVWDYQWPPVMDWPNLPRPHEYYGCNDIGVNGNLNDGLNFTASNMQRIIKHHAHPKTIGTGFKSDQLTRSGIDRLWTVSDPGAKIYNLEMQSDLSSSMEYMQFLRQSFFQGIREIDPATVQDKLGAMTNFGLRVLFRDSLEKTGTKRLLYGHGLRCACRYMLELGGFAGQKVTDSWPDPLPQDSVAQATALQIDRDNGLSQDTYLQRRGFDPDAERERREQEIAEGAMRDTMAQQGALLERFRAARVNGNERQPTGQSNGAANGAAGGRMAGMERRGY